MRRRLFLLGVLLHVAILIGWAGWLELARARAVTVRLEVVPGDPRDLLRGDYVWIRYRISEIPWSRFVPIQRPEDGQRVYVALAPRDGVHEAVAASLSRATLPLPRGHLLLLGTVEYPSWRDRGTRVVFGIERYYVPEGKGTPPRGKMEAEVALTPDGRPFLTRLLVDGRPYP
jgi:uncharacterized membrane-anchored protein